MSSGSRVSGGAGIEGGLEPPPGCGHTLLKLARLWEQEAFVMEARTPQIKVGDIVRLRNAPAQVGTVRAVLWNDQTEEQLYRVQIGAPSFRKMVSASSRWIPNSATGRCAIPRPWGRSQPPNNARSGATQGERF